MSNPAPIESSPLTIAMVAGEISGDNLGAPLIREMKLSYPDARFVGVGGPAMIAEGMESWFDIDRLSVNGFIDPLKRLPELINILRTIRSRLLLTPPDCFVGIDFNFFNLLLEGLLKRRGIRTVHYVSPTVWAWRSGRVKGIKKNVDLMLTLYPFETPIYEKHGVGVRFVGHPKAREIHPEAGPQKQGESRRLFGYAQEDSVIAILPGSRGSEIGYSGPDFFSAARLIRKSKPGSKFIVPAVNERRRVQIEKMLQESYPDIEVQLVVGQSREVITASDVVLVNSGTATLEALLLKKPMVMSYRLGALTYGLISRIVKTQFFALPNILAGRELIPELMQHAATAENLSEAVLRMFDPHVRQELIAEFDVIHRQLRLDSGSEACDAILDLCGRARQRGGARVSS